jgi:hypothetical protein
MKGADQCPECGSRKWAQGYKEMPPVPGLDLLPKHVRVCRNPACACIWEFFDEAELLDEGRRYSSFKEPCDNCAFRPGSPEQKDPAKWKELVAGLELSDSCQPKGMFFCHKGVPLDLERISPTDSGYKYPVDAAGKFDQKKNRPCRGYYRMISVQLRRVFDAEKAEMEQHAWEGLGHA